MAGRKKGSQVKQTAKFKEKRKKTQFGAPGGNKPFGARDYNPMNLRGAQRHLASQEIDPRDSKALDKLMGHHTCSIAELIAFTQLQKAIGGDNVAIAAVTDNLCGKLEDVHVVKTPGVIADIPNFASDAEALAAWKNDIKGT